MDKYQQRRQKRRLWPRVAFLAAILIAVALLSFLKYQPGTSRKITPVKTAAASRRPKSAALIFTGRILADNTSQPIKNAAVSVGEKTVYSDDLGLYRIKIAPGSWQVYVSADGFTPLKKEIKVQKKTLRLNFFLVKKAAYFPPGSPLPPIQPQVIYRGNPNQKKVAITIDDGWNADNRIIDLLEKYDIKVTVFIIGGRDVGETHPEWISRLDKAGFEVATHTYDHYVLTNLSDKAIAADVLMGQEVITKITNKKYPYMRPSGGIYNQRVLSQLASLGYKVILWSIDLGDTRPGATVDEEVNNVLSRLSNGDIILTHFGGHNTYETLSRLIPEIQKRGYQITTVSEVLEE